MAEEFDEVVRKPLLAHVPGFIHPNHLSLARAVLLAPLIVYRNDPTIAVGIIVASSVCDLLDGPLARVRGQKSEEGAVLDATSDKIFLNGAAFYACDQAIPEPIRWTALGIDIFLTLIRPLKERYGVSTCSNRWGGGKVWAYSIGVGLAYMNDSGAWMLAHPVYLVGIALAILSVGGHILDIVRAFGTEMFSS
ncbi:CDP-alcohol phosphatidyltransferase family protein [Candidatus Uhrbacteria bacterium]|nr:CDP-alcohol phosphatidyltransferase family protein [Candidatus Uhrbacteria bacterium]